MSVQLFKNGNRMAIQTDCQTEGAFVSEFVSLLSDMVEQGTYEGDWEFQLGGWLSEFADICCKYRGQRHDVQEETILISGDKSSEASPDHEIDSSYKSRIGCVTGGFI